MRPDIPYYAAMKWEYRQYGRLAREHRGVPNSGPFAGLNMKKRKGIHCEVFLARLREIGIGATMLNKAAYRSV